MIRFAFSSVNGSAAIAVEPFGYGEGILEPCRGKVVVGDLPQGLEHLELIALLRDPEQNHGLHGRAAGYAAGELPYVDARISRQLEPLARPLLHAVQRVQALRRSPGGFEHRISLSDACENAAMAADKFLLAGVMGWPVMHSRSPMMHNYWFRKHALAGTYVPLAIRPEHLAGALRGL